MRGVRGVVAVDHFADEEGVRMPSPYGRQDPLPEARRHRVGRVEPPAGRAAVEPVVQHVRHIVAYGGFVMVEGDKPVVPLEGLVVDRTVPGLPPPEPCRGRPVRAFGNRPGERRKRTADVVEHAVQHDAQTAPPGRGDQVVEVVIAAESRIDPEVIHRVVPMGLGREDRSEQEPRATQVHRVLQPPFRVPQPRPNRCPGQRRDRRAGEPQRVHLPPDRVVDP